MVQLRSRKGDANGTATAEALKHEVKDALENTWAATHGLGDRAGAFGTSGWVGSAINNLGCLFLMLSTPLAAVHTYLINDQFDGSLTAFFSYLRSRGVSGLIEPLPMPNLLSVQFLAAFGLFQVALLLFLPGKRYRGPVTPHGAVPVYPANGVQSYFVTLALFFGLWKAGVIDPGLVYDNFGPMLQVLNIFALSLLVFLYFKGIYAPSTPDSGKTGNILYDIFWGTELHPSLGKSLYIKQWTNCRMGMMGWAVLILCFAIKQYQVQGFVSDSMLVSVALMQVYIFKFFLWETGYMASMDICHDRAGFMICWGCLVWVPAVYTAPAMYLVKHPVALGPPLAGLILIAGLFSVYVNYDADRQRQAFREANGKRPVWGKPPVMIKAQYTTASNEVKSSLLLASGWWGVARHFHYLPEILGSFFWTLPCLFAHAQPYFYVVYLTILLSDRSLRDDARCRAKYGKYWEQYCQLVPYKMVPGLF